MRGDASYFLLMIAYPIVLVAALLLWPHIALWVFLSGIPLAGAVWTADAREKGRQAERKAATFPWFRLLLVLTTFAWPYAIASLAHRLRSSRGKT